MSFVFWAALGLAALVAGPVVAHLLRRGRAEEREFPAASLVPALRSTARQRSRLEDWTLLVVRSAIIVGLAVLGATPLVRCERLSLSRASGGSVALALVLDDSLSMRFVVNGSARWDTAKNGARDLLRSVRDGDSVAIVLAGRPARVALAPTTDLSAARQALDDIGPSDRPTDIPAAVTLARTALRGLPQKDHRVIVLSDLAGERIPDGTPVATTPLPDLTRKADDCAVTSAERQGSRVKVDVACSSEAAATGRPVDAVVLAAQDGRTQVADGGSRHVTAGDVVAHAELASRAGEQTLMLDVGTVNASLEARLGGKDACQHDDSAPVCEESGLRRIAVVADPRSASAKTGGPTVIEQAIQALNTGFTTQAMPMAPDDEKALQGIGALAIDDPRGFSPEAREAITRFVEKGGVALSFLGPRAAATGLGWTLEPFARGAARWEAASGLSLDAASATFLGPEAQTLADIGARGRVRLDGMEIAGSRVLGRWSDSVPWLLERRVGRGLCLTVGLPVSPEESDLPLRPAFLSLLDHVLRQADLRKGTRRSVAGTAWIFDGVTRAGVEGPEGPVPVTVDGNDETCSDDSEGPCVASGPHAIGAVRGRYTVKLDGQEEARVVTLEPTEILAEPQAPGARATSSVGGEAAWVGASREVALMLLALFGIELAIRLIRRWRAPLLDSSGA